MHALPVDIFALVISPLVSEIWLLEPDGESKCTEEMVETAMSVSTIQLI